MEKANKVVDIFATAKNKKGTYEEIPNVTGISLPEVTPGEGEIAGAGIFGTVAKPDFFNLEAMEASVTVSEEDSKTAELLENPSGIHLKLNYAVDKVNGLGQEDYNSHSAVIKGYPKVIPGGDVKKGEKGEFTHTVAVRYYKKSVNGKVLHEIDPLNGVLIINGVNYAKKLNNALNK